MSRNAVGAANTLTMARWLERHYQLDFMGSLTSGAEIALIDQARCCFWGRGADRLGPDPAPNGRYMCDPEFRRGRIRGTTSDEKASWTDRGTFYRAAHLG